MARTTQLHEAIQAALARNGIAGDITGLERLTAGAASETWALDLERDGTSSQYIFQRTLGKSVFSLSIGRATQAALQKLAAQHGLPVPHILFACGPEDGLGDAYLAARLDGETRPQPLQDDPAYRGLRASFGAQCGNILAGIHALPAEGIGGLPRLSPAETLERYQALYRGFAIEVPLFEVALQWLQKNPPAARPLTLVHGDFRLGNIMVHGGRINGVLDWELAHIGDPYADLTWIAEYSWRFAHPEKPIGGISGREEFYGAYEAATGTALDPGRIRFWELFNALRWGIMCLFMTRQFLSGEVPTIERAAIGRRVSETAYNLVLIFKKIRAEG